MFPDKETFHHELDDMPIHITSVMGDTKINITVVQTKNETSSKKDVTSMYLLNDVDSTRDMLQDVSNILSIDNQKTFIYDGRPPSLK